jgi:hypothetical protein
VNPATLLLWEGLIGQAASLGVKSWTAIHGLLQDAGADDAAIAALQPKWDVLVADVARAAGPHS